MSSVTSSSAVQYWTSYSSLTLMRLASAGPRLLLLSLMKSLPNERSGCLSLGQALVNRTSGGGTINPLGSISVIALYDGSFALPASQLMVDEKKGEVHMTGHRMTDARRSCWISACSAVSALTDAVGGNGVEPAFASSIQRLNALSTRSDRERPAGRAALAQEPTPLRWP